MGAGAWLHVHACACETFLIANIFVCAHVHACVRVRVYVSLRVGVRACTFSKLAP